MQFWASLVASTRSASIVVSTQRLDLLSTFVPSVANRKLRGTWVRLDLDFGRVGLAHVDLANISEDQYTRIQEYFVPLVNDAKVKSRVAIGGAFVFATNLCPDANPSDIWHHVLYRTYCREKIGTNPEQSWVRTSGEGFEIALVER